MNAKRKKFNNIISHIYLLNESVEENTYKVNNRNNKNLFLKKTKEKTNLIKKGNTKIKKSEFDILNILNKDIIQKNKYKKITPLFSNIIFIFIIALILSKANTFLTFSTLLSNDYSITIKIKPSGLQRIFFKGGDPNVCEGITYNPDLLKINGNALYPIPNEYNFPGTDNTIEISWNEPITSFACLFYTCSEINEIDLSNYDTSAINNMKSMFLDCASLTSINFGNIITSNVVEMHYMFCGCSALKELDLSKFNTERVTNMRIMFGLCSSLVSLDLSLLDTSHVVDMGYLFFECSNLKSINLKNKFSTESVTEMDFMFSGCSALESLDLSGFNTINSRNMSFMFEKCSSLTNLDLSYFSTPSVIDLGYMFKECHSLNWVIIYNFRTENVISMKGMFSSCFVLTSLNLGHFNTPQVYIPNPNPQSPIPIPQSILCTRKKNNLI